MSALGAQPILRVEGVGKRYGGLQALEDVSLEVAHGQLHSVVGPNGAGKSTLFNIICGLERPDAGTVTFQGRRTDRLPAWKVSRLGMVRKFQAPTVFGELTVAENVRVAATGKRGWLSLVLHRNREVGVIEAALEDMELSAQADMLAGSLAHGEQQRLEIAMVLATNPALLLLDEPTAGLSAEETATTGRLLRRLAERCAVLVVEHDLGFIRQVSDWVTVLDHGRKLSEGDVDDIAADERVREAYLGRQVL